MARKHSSGPIVSQTKETDGAIFIPASLADFFTGTWTKTRLAAGDIVLRKTAADEAGQFSFPLGAILLQKIGDDPANLDTPHDIRGFEVVSMDLIYGIATEALDAHSFDIHEVTYADNVANAVDSTLGGTLLGSLATAIQANPYVTNVGPAVASPIVVGRNTALRNLILEVSWDAAATTVLDYYGLYVRYNYNLL
ncbi:hypothetical protein IIA15_07890 [candidate division TA06 bacterium]|nr:hypothetical protein [candidate division TA06 bacterium]